jgi:hypothetical protein
MARQIIPHIWTAAIFIPFCVMGCTTPQKTDSTGISLVDYHVHLKGGLTIDEAVAAARRNGVKYGIAPNCGKGFPVTDDAALLAYIESMKGKGVYIGMQAEGREWVSMFSPEAIAKADYVFTDGMTWTDSKGRRMRLWMPDEVFVDDKYQFMEELVETIEWILSHEPIDIYANPTYLPPMIAAEYDTLWTPERMDRVIAALVKNDVAIEINSKFRLPSETFIRRAKAAGAKFSCGTNNGGRDDLGNLEYSREMIAKCKLTQKDLFVPKPNGKKPVQRKKLPQPRGAATGPGS